VSPDAPGSAQSQETENEQDDHDEADDIDDLVHWLGASILIGQGPQGWFTVAPG
jgi:hypothetical protein